MHTTTTARLAVLLTLGLLAAPASGATLSLYTLPEGSTILQLSGAVAGDTAGGVATEERRTIYYFQPDFGDPQPNVHDFTGTTWPYVFLDGPLKIDSGVSADVDTASTDAGTILLINGNPVYQFFGDNTSKDANGNFGPWFFIRPDGSPTQATVVPVPAALPLLLTALAGFGFLRRRN